MSAPLLLATCLATTAWAAPTAPPSPWSGYLDDAAFDARLRAVDASPRATVTTLGTSRQGRTIPVVTLADSDTPDATRPAMLVIAGLDPLHQAGTEYAVRIAENLLESHAELLDEVTIFVVPRLNPDGVAALRTGPIADRRGNARTVDADRDGLLDEDGPQDLDGDGVITMMRIANPPLAHPATHLADPGAPRLMRTPDRSEGERATHAMMIEGLDADGDGLVGEDGTGEVRIDRNFMHLYREHETDSGPYQLSEPESLALAEFVVAHPTIIGAVVYGPHDTIINLPEAKKNDITGRTPVGIDENDLPIFKSLQTAYKDAVGQTRTGDDDDAGGVHAWLYAHRGIPTAAVTGWGRPDVPEPEDDSAADSEVEGDTDTATADDATPETPPAPKDAEAAGWLAWSDHLDGAGFVDWHAFEHPQFGTVEIGGWVPGFQMNPPAAELDEFGRKQTAFVAAMAAMRPMLDVEGPEVEDLGGGLVRVRFAIRNDGDLPLRTAMSRRNDAIRPLALRLSTDLDRILQGRRQQLVDELAGSGGRAAFEWVIRLADGDTITLDDPQFGVRTLEITTAGTGGDR
jgi:hypothetical protein